MLGELADGRAYPLGTNLQIAYFDQYRAQLDEEKSVVDNAQGSDRGQRPQHTRHRLFGISCSLPNGPASR